MSSTRPQKTRRKQLKSSNKAEPPAHNEKNPGDLVQVVRAALSGRSRDLQLVIRRVANSHRDDSPALADELMTLLRDNPHAASPLRRANAVPVPLDHDSQLRLLRIEESVELPHEPVFATPVRESLDQLVEERVATDKLAGVGLLPTRSALFTGPPGVGKTMAARWIARSLDQPLMVLDLSAVMSSFLGRTGNNVRAVLDYAKASNAVFLIDEFDAIAKRRDDGTEVGELKRLVTVLLQEIDEWPATGLLIAATNHPDLLDPAVWRRFEVRIDFPYPENGEAEALIRLFLDGTDADSHWPQILALVLAGQSHSDLERTLINVRRSVALDRCSIEEGLLRVVQTAGDRHSKDDQIRLAVQLVNEIGVSQRKAESLTGISRETLRKRLSSQRGSGAAHGK